MNWKNISWYLYPLAGFVLLVFFSLTQSFNLLDMRLYDLMLRFRPTPHEDPRILLLEIDDATIGDVGTYPLGREIVANGTLRCWENQAAIVIYDSQYIDPSPRGVNESWLEQEIPRQVEVSLGEVESFGSGLSDALAAGQIPAEALGDYLGEYSRFTDSMEQDLLDSINQVILDKDKYLGQAVALLDRAVITVGTLEFDDPYVSQELKDSAKAFALSPTVIDHPPVGQAEDIRPSIASISQSAMTLGFPRVHIDPDGVRRQIDLVYQWEESLFPQLGLAALTHWLQPSGYSLNRRYFTMEQITWPDGTTQDELKIPLSRGGRMYINWPHKKFLESFRHFSFRNLYVQDIYEAALMDNLRQLDSWGILAMYQGDNPLQYLEYAEGYLQEALQGTEGRNAEEYRMIRDAGFQALSNLAQSSLEEEGLAEINRLLEMPDFPETEKAALRQLAQALPILMENLNSLAPELLRMRAETLEELQDSLIILGYTGESTQDIGVSPFESEYMNMGIHGAVINTVLQQDFIDDVPHILSILTGFLISIILAFILFRGKSWRSMTAAILVWVFCLSLLVFLFRMTGIYPGMLFPLLSTVLISIILLVTKFIRENQEKGFIKNAFGQYLSSEVIETILDDPSMLNLGGTEKELTAIFTDVKGFSTISEQLTPPQLVQLLNRYLTSFSDIVMDNKGTIDKFEGDAIIAFYGAPHDLKNHASAALISAMQMKKVEKELNREFLECDPPLTPSPLLTRIGVNTGPMVVGNMGTLRKMDYTIMGNAVNLAARLEGVNKQYNTWVLASHFTYNQAKNDVVGRPLDRVRVVGIKEPVQLYEVMAEKSSASRELKEQIEHFDRIMEIFRGQKWKEAEQEFRKYSELFPDDATASIYMERIVNYLKKPPTATWDGVYNLTQK